MRNRLLISIYSIFLFSAHARPEEAVPFLALPMATEATYPLLYRRNADPSTTLSSFTESPCRWPEEYHWDGSYRFELPAQVTLQMAEGHRFVDGDELHWLVADPGELYRLPERDELFPTRSGHKRLDISGKLVQLPRVGAAQALYLVRKAEGVFALVATWTGKPPRKVVVDPTTWRKVTFETVAGGKDAYFLVTRALRSFPDATEARATVRMAPGPYLLSRYAADADGTPRPSHLMLEVTGDVPSYRIEPRHLAPPPKPFVFDTLYKYGATQLETELPRLASLAQPIRVSKIEREIVPDRSREFYDRYGFSLELAVDTVQLQNEKGDTYDASASEVRLDRERDALSWTDSALSSAIDKLGADLDGVPVRYRLVARLASAVCQRLDADVYDGPPPGGKQIGIVEVWSAPRARSIQWSLKERWKPIVTPDDTTGVPAPRSALDESGAKYVDLGHRFLAFLGERQGDWVSYVSSELPAKVWLRVGKADSSMRVWSWSEPIDYTAAFPAFQATAPLPDAQGRVAIPTKGRFQVVARSPAGLTVRRRDGGDDAVRRDIAGNGATGAETVLLPWDGLRDKLGKPRFLPAPAGE